MNKLYITLCTLLISLNMSAQTLATFPHKDTFEHSFFNEYVPRQCGSNIKSFTEKLHSLSYDLSNTYILIITNEGSSVFGMVNALQARHGGSLDRETGLYAAGEQNWYHHVVLDYNGFIFDFDFTNEPVAISKIDYFYQMFFKNHQLSYLKTSPKKKMTDYQIELIPAYTYIEAKKNNKPLPNGEKLRLQNYLNL